MIPSAPKGQVFRISTTVVSNSTYVTPTTIALYVKDPAGTTTTVSSSQATSTGTGAYYYDFTVSSEGMFYYKWITTGSGAGAETGQFRGLDTPFD